MEIKDLYNKIYKTLLKKKMKEDINGNTFHVHGLEDFTLLKMPILGLP